MAHEELPLLDPTTLSPSLNPILVVDGKGLEQLKKYLSEPRPFVKDYETNVVPSFYQRRARTLQLGDKDQQFIIDLLAFADGDEQKLWNAQGGYRRHGAVLTRRYYNEAKFNDEGVEIEEAGEYEIAEPTQHTVDATILQPVVDIIQPAFDSDAFLKIGHNLEFEYIVGKWGLGIRSWHFYDTLIAERLLWNGAVPAHQRDFYGLDDLVARYFGMRISKDEQTTFNLKDPLTDKQIIYTALDVRLPWGLRAMQLPKIRKAQIDWTVQIENDAVPAFGDMHMNGLFVDPVKWQKIIDDNEAELVKALEETDKHFIPLVGRKELPDPERVKKAHELFKAQDVPTQEEKDVTERIKAARRGRGSTEFAEQYERLVEYRSRLQAERMARKAEYKAAHKAISYLATKTYADEVAKMQGEAKINYGSWQQVMKALYDGPWGFNKTTLPDLDAKTTLLKYLDKKLPTYSLILAAYNKFKKIEKQLGTYGYRWITPRNIKAKDSTKTGFVDPDTGRIHPPFRQLGTDTGRPSCSDPNVLNLPKEARFRACFTARPGKKMATKDCSGQELRILCEISREPSWVEAFNNDEDLHSISTDMIIPEKWRAGTVHEPTEMLVENKQGIKEKKLVPACTFFHSEDGRRLKCKCPEHDTTRGKFKAVNFGVAYDKQAYSLAIELGIPESEAQEILDGWKETFQITQAALEKLRQDAYDRGEARTLSNRRRILTKVTKEQVQNKADEKYSTKGPDGKFIKKKHSRYTLDRVAEQLISAVKREGGNMPIQGTGADMMKLAMGCGFDPNGNPYLWHILGPYYDADLENYVYDEFLVEVPEQYAEVVGGVDGKGGVISDAIIRAGSQFVTVVPMASEGAIADSWTK